MDLSSQTTQDVDSHVNTRFGTFTGVFTPTLLTILGVIMYVRLGWVVGNAGLMGAWLILVIAMGITACTGLSLSSIATNTRIGAGGPYAIISKSLGLDVGGAIGIPLYLSRPFGVAMYVFGFREGWLWFFPEHDPFLVDMFTFGAIFLVAYLSANLAFRVQFAIMAIIGVSLLAIVASPESLSRPDQVIWWGDFQGFPEEGFGGIGFWVAFAILFPATTGILAGANMSGDLKDPRRAIPVGTLWAIVISAVIYFALAYWCAASLPNEALLNNYNAVIDAAFFPAAVALGLLGATFSSALASAVGGPRILMAMGQHRIVPASRWLARTTRGEPRNSIVVTAALAFVGLMMRDLNAIAPLITMFFLITYFTINVVLLIESSLGLVSFRPTMRIPRFVPLVGAVGCVFVMWIVNPAFSVISVVIVVAVYLWLSQRGVQATGEDVRSGLFSALAEWAAAKVTEQGEENVRAWKPNLMLPVEDPTEVRGLSRLLMDVCRPEGSVKLLGLATERSIETLQPEVQELAHSFEQKQLFTSSSIVDSAGFTAGVMNGLQALQSAFFRPNILFLTLPDDAERDSEFGDIIVQAHNTGVGVMMAGMHSKANLGQCSAINLWLRPARTGWSARAAFRSNNLNLTLLIGYRLMRQWNAKLRLITAVPTEEQLHNGRDFLDDVCELARIPEAAERHVMVGAFKDCATNGPQADISILGLQANPDFDFMRDTIEWTASTCLFVADSGRESAMA